MNRRDFIGTAIRSSLSFCAAAGIAGLSAFAPASSARAIPRTSSDGLPAAALLESSPFVYISPLLANGNESTCHAELWFAWMGGAVVATVGRDRWKARSIFEGRDRARIWIGDHGIWRGFLWNNEDFRRGPSFDARGEIVEDSKLLDALLARYETKYPAEIAQWRDRMREGHENGSRVLVRYAPPPR